MTDSLADFFNVGVGEVLDIFAIALDIYLHHELVTTVEKFRTKYDDIDNKLELIISSHFPRASQLLGAGEDESQDDDDDDDDANRSSQRFDIDPEDAHKDDSQVDQVGRFKSLWMAITNKLLSKMEEIE